MILSDEQTIALLDACDFNVGNVKVEAPPGSGKSTLVKAIAKEMSKTNKKGLGIAFNTEMARKIRKSGISCPFKTYHGLAWGYLSADKKARVNNITPWAVIKALNLKPINGIPSVMVAYDTIATLINYCQSDEQRIEKHHFRPHLPRSAEYKHAIRVNAILLWNKIWEPGSTMPIPHDVYLKRWVNTRKKPLGYDYIIVDEDQDLNPVVLSLLKKQPCKIITVGDQYQQIYEWRGAVNAGTYLNYDEIHWLTRSYRFGKEIAEMAMSVLKAGLNADRTIIGNPNVKSTVTTQNITPRNAFLAKTNSSLFARLMIEKGPIYISGSAGQMRWMLEAVERIMEGKPAQHPILSSFGSWRDVVEFAPNDNTGELARLVRAVETFGIQALTKAMTEKTTRYPEQAKIVLSTIHSAKGQEFSCVSLADDFKPINEMNDEEVRTLYVAVTRAKEKLQVPHEIMAIKNAEKLSTENVDNTQLISANDKIHS